jgi:hypothetical protein
MFFPKFTSQVLKIVQRSVEERGLLNASQFGFHACHSITPQCMSLTDHISLDFNNNMSTAAVLLDMYAKEIIFNNMLYVRYIHVTKVKHIHKRETHSVIREDVP